MCMWCILLWSQVVCRLREAGFMADIDDDRGNTLNKKIRSAQLAQYNYIFGTDSFWCVFIQKCFVVSQFICAVVCGAEMARFTFKCFNGLIVLCWYTCKERVLWGLLGEGQINESLCVCHAVVGEKESVSGTVSVRTRSGKQLGQKSLQEVMRSLNELRQTRSNLEEY